MIENLLTLVRSRVEPQATTNPLSRPIEAEAGRNVTQLSKLRSKNYLCHFMKYV